MVSNFSANQSRQFTLLLPAPFIDTWALQEKNYVLISGFSRNKLKLVENDHTAKVNVQMAPLESLVLQLQDN